MKKLFYITAILVTLISFTGCYADRPMYGPPAGRVVIAPSPYYYRSAPVIVGSYRGHGRYGRGWHRGYSGGYGRY